MSIARESHTVTLLSSGEVLVTGGTSSYSGPLGTRRSELYDPETDTWNSTGEMHYSRVHHTATLLSTGKVLVVGGIGSAPRRTCTAPATGTWLPTTPLPKPFITHDAVLLHTGEVLIPGGNAYYPALSRYYVGPIADMVRFKH